MKRLDLVVGPNGAGKTTFVTRTLLPALPYDTFVNETVFSHPSKLELIRDARKAGYTVVLHVLLIPEDLAVARVSYRVRAGGHSVPSEKIRERYGRLWTHVVVAIAEVQTVIVYDNSRGEGPKRVAAFHGGIELAGSDWPAWTPDGLRTADFLRHHFTETNDR